MVGMRPRKTTTKPIPAMKIHDQWFLTTDRVSFLRPLAGIRASLRRSRGKLERSRSTRGKLDRAVRSAAISPLILQRCGDSFQANKDRLHTAGDHDQTRPVENRETSE